jgi:transcriptional regulator with PAS, ATPase and Fis domain
MKEALETARKIAATPHGTVLILGESGVGKDRFARAIHYESSRVGQPFMEISCTAIPEALLESELFGNEKGAYTGATERKKGLFETAAGGTVFLNEIGHMPLSLQAKMLRVLEDKTFKRVGGREDITVDVRIIAATNEILEDAIAKKTFREDLYYRINVLAIKLRPLRERKDDILPLVDLMLEDISRELRKPKPELLAETKDALLDYSWPGNVRELRNAVERMLILGETEFRPLTHKTVEPKAKETVIDEGAIVALEDLEKDMIQKALAKTGQNQKKAALLLGISRDALRRRIEKFGMNGFEEESE